MYAADKACVFTKDGPSDLFDCSIGVKQGCPLSPLLFSLYLDVLETLLEEASGETDCPRLAELLIAILLFADDIALFSYTTKGLQRQLDILHAFCSDRGLKVNVQNQRPKDQEREGENPTCPFSQHWLMRTRPCLSHLPK